MTVPKTLDFDPFDYPRRWEADVVLSDGGTVHLRPIVPTDADQVVSFHGGLSEQTRYFRYLGAYPRIPARDLRRFTTVDHHDRVALVALLGGEILAIGRYERLKDTITAEVAFVVADAHQGRGLGSILLEHLTAAARESDLARFGAEVLAENSQMVRVFRDAGYHVSRELESGVVHLEFDIDATDESVAVSQAREQSAEARSVHNLLHPHSVAVIGASADPTKVGRVVLNNLLAAEFTGPVYPVNPEHHSISGVRAYPSVLDIPDSVDLAVVTIPAAGVDQVLDACLAKGVNTLVVISSGFADAGEDGRTAERRLVSEARAHGMRVVGPNALGVVNTDPAVKLNATLAPRVPGAGKVGFFCQSGALGTTILANAAARGLGLSTFVSAGNRADVSGNDMLQYWETDPKTEVVLLYLESFGNPRKFARLARRLGRHKPIVAVKSGRHAITPGLASTSVRIDESSVSTLFEQAGVIRVDSLAELFDTALVLANQPLPRGERVGIVGNSTAIGVLATDIAMAHDLVVSGQQVDVGPTASPEGFARAVRAALLREDIDSLIVVFVPPIAVPGKQYAQALREVVFELIDAGQQHKPIVSTFLAMEGVPDELSVPGDDGTTPGFGSIPSYPSPERAVAALARVTRYSGWSSAPLGEFRYPEGIRLDDARAIVDNAVAAIPDGDIGQLSEVDAVRLLHCYGIDIVPFETATTSAAAVVAAERLGYPVTLKSASAALRNRIDLLGVRLDLFDQVSVEEAYGALQQEGSDPQVYVQKMAPKGVSCVIGLQEDPSFGALVSFGIAGMISDLIEDKSYRSVPLTDRDAAWLVRAPKSAPLLAGWKGLVPANLAALEDVVLRVSALAADLPEIRGLTLEPVLASSEVASVTNAQILVGVRRVVPDSGPRRLRTLGRNR